MTGRVRTWLPVFLSVVAVLVLGWVVSSAELSSRSTPIPQLDFSEEPPSEEPSSQESSPPQDAPAVGGHRGVAPVVGLALSGLMYAVVGGLLLALVGFLIYRFIRTPPAQGRLADDRAASRPSAEELREALKAGLTDIDAGGDPRRAVVSCWLRLEQAAAAAGVERLASETPTELMTRVLAAYRVNDQALTALAGAYHQARYAPHEVSEGLRETARAALAEVDSQLAAARLREVDA